MRYRTLTKGSGSHTSELPSAEEEVARQTLVVELPAVANPFAGRAERRARYLMPPNAAKQTFL